MPSPLPAARRSPLRCRLVFSVPLAALPLAAIALAVVLAAWLSAPARLHAQDQQGVERWENAIRQLESLDKTEEHPDDAILFIGSSSVRLWKTIDEDMAPWPAIRRGYGGAKYSDLRHYAKRLVHPHTFRAVAIFVANDVSGRPTDRTPETVADDARAVIEVVRAKDPQAPVFLIAITPTRSRWEVWNKTQGVNGALAELASDLPNVHYIATAAHFLGDDGRPREKLFVSDQLHLNEDGYDLWARLIKRRLREVLGEKARTSAEASDERSESNP